MLALSHGWQKRLISGILLPTSCVHLNLSLETFRTHLGTALSNLLQLKREGPRTTFYPPGRCLITSRLGLPSSLTDLLITALNTAGGRGLLQEAGLVSDGMEAMSYRTARRNQHKWWPVPCPHTYPPSPSPPAKRPQTFRQSGNSKFSWLTTFMKASGFRAFSCLMASSEFAGACIENRIAINSHILCLCKRLLLLLNTVMKVCFYLVIMG